MTVKYTIWDKKSDLYPLVGGKLTPAQVFAKWGWTERPDSVVLITEQGGTLCSIDNLEILKGNFGIETADVKSAITEIEHRQNTAAEALVDAIREEGREEVRAIVREAAMLGTLSMAVQTKLKEKGIL